MSATQKIGLYDVSSDALWDEELQAYYARIGKKTKKGLILHYTSYSATKEKAMERAELLARILSKVQYFK
jgi:hypothetical protein